MQKKKRKLVIYNEIVPVMTELSLTGQPALVSAWLSKWVKKSKSVSVPAPFLSKLLFLSWGGGEKQEHCGCTPREVSDAFLL